MSEVAFYSEDSAEWDQAQSFEYPDYSTDFDYLNGSVDNVADVVRTEADGIKQQMAAYEREEAAAEADRQERQEEWNTNFFKAISNLDNSASGIYERVMQIDTNLRAMRYGDYEKEQIIFEDGGQGGEKVLFKASGAEGSEDDGNEDLVEYTVTLNDIHDDLLTLNDNFLYGTLLQFAGFLAVLGLMLGKGIWKNW